MVKFGNPTTFQNDCVPQATQPRQSFKLGAAAPGPNAPFHCLTSHRLDFVPHELGPKPTPVQPRHIYRPSSQSFQGVTMHRCTFQELGGAAAKACRPACSRGAPHVPFEGHSEFQDSFQPWELPTPQVKPVQVYAPPSGAMQQHSTNRLDYVSHQAPPCTAPIRRASQRREKHPFQGRSTTQEDFREWEACRPRAPVKPQQQMPGLSGMFDGVSTFQSHYVPHKLVPTVSCKPVQALVHSFSPFDGVTSYSTEFAAKKQEVCPAGYLSPPGYIFENTNSRGHQFFRKIAPSSTQAS